MQPGCSRSVPWTFAASGIFALVVGLGARAHADVLDAALEQPLTEVSHSVQATVRDGIAVYKVRRVFANAGGKADEARLEIDLPYGAAATGLRIRARDRWYDGELMEAEAAARMYKELTGRGLWQPKDPALLYWRWPDKLVLQVFPVLPGATSTVEYTLTVPTRYQGGKVVLSYPRLGAGHAPNLAVPVFTIAPGWGDATTLVTVDGKRVAPGVPLVFDAVPEAPWLAAIPHEPDASYVSSAIEIADTPAARRPVTTARVTIDLEHTFRGDLQLALVPPGASVGLALEDRKGSGENDVRGTFEVKLPAGTVVPGTWRLVVSDHAALDVGTLESWTLELGAGVKERATDTPVFIPDVPENASDGGVAQIALAPPVIDVVATRLGRVVASPQHAFTRLEIDAAPELRPVPKRPQVVFAIDASRSLGEDGIATQLAVVAAYLSHVPDAEVELVTYRRAATRVFGAFVPAAEFAAKLAAARQAGKLAPGNGSALDEGARLAVAALAGRRGPLRVVFTTDDLLRARFDNALALAPLRALDPGAVVHVVTLEDTGELALERQDQHARAPIALAHHGIGAVLRVPDRADKHLPRAVLGLVRPMRIDGLALRGVDLTSGNYDETIPTALEEGAGVRVVVDAATAADTVELTGMIWGDRFRRVVRADGAFSRAAAAWVFSEDDHQGLTPAEMMTVALMGRAVSPVTSYLAVEPGVRPSVVGLDHEVSMSGLGFGGGSGSGQGFGVGGAAPPNPMTLVAEAARQCVRQWKPAAGWLVKLTLETTRDEVVDVVPVAGAELPIAACLVEAVWALRLPGSFRDERHVYPLEFR